MAEMTLGQAADAVLATLDEFGWCQRPDTGAWQDGKKVPICLGIALQIAIARYQEDNEVFIALDKNMMRLIAIETGRPAMVAWNDSPSTSEEDVRLLVKKAGHDV